MAIFVTGDTHGSRRYGHFDVDGFMNRLNMSSFPEQRELTKDDYVVICGDFGGVWDWSGETAEEKHALDWLDTRNFTTLFVPGNHENYDRLTGIEAPALLDSWMYRKLPEEERIRIRTGYPQRSWHGGMVREIRESVLMLERGYVFEIDGRKCFSFGGARSHDISDGILEPMDYENNKKMRVAYKKWEESRKMFRVNHISWWSQEMPLETEMERGRERLEAEKYKVDFIFTHDTSISSKIEVMSSSVQPDQLTLYLEEIKNKVDYKKWFFGHLHENRMCAGGKDIALYEQIIRIN